MRRELSRNAYAILARYQVHKANITPTLTLNMPKGLGNHMKLLIEGGVYHTMDELVTDAVRILLEARTHSPVQSHEYCWNRLMAERDVEITDDELDRVIHEIRTEVAE